LPAFGDSRRWPCWRAIRAFWLATFPAVVWKEETEWASPSNGSPFCFSGAAGSGGRAFSLRLRLHLTFSAGVFVGGEQLSQYYRLFSSLAVRRWRQTLHFLPGAALLALHIFLRASNKSGAIGVARGAAKIVTCSSTGGRLKPKESIFAVTSVKKRRLALSSWVRRAAASLSSGVKTRLLLARACLRAAWLGWRRSAACCGLCFSRLKRTLGYKVCFFPTSGCHRRGHQEARRRAAAATLLCAARVGGGAGRWRKAAGTANSARHAACQRCRRTAAAAFCWRLSWKRGRNLCTPPLAYHMPATFYARTLLHGRLPWNIERATARAAQARGAFGDRMLPSRSSRCLCGAALAAAAAWLARRDARCGFRWANACALRRRRRRGYYLSGISGGGQNAGVALACFYRIPGVLGSRLRAAAT